MEFSLIDLSTEGKLKIIKDSKEYPDFIKE